MEEQVRTIAFKPESLKSMSMGTDEASSSGFPPTQPAQQFPPCIDHKTST